MTSNSDKTYLVHLPDGSELGPASLDDLRAWVAAGVIGKTTALSLVGTEARIPAVTVEGLFGRVDVPTTPPAVHPQRPQAPPPTLSPRAQRTQPDAKSCQAPATSTTANFGRTKSDAVIGWVGVVLGVLVFLMGILLPFVDSKDEVLRDVEGKQILTRAGEVYPKESAWLLALYHQDPTTDSMEVWLQRQGIDTSSIDLTVGPYLRQHEGERITIVDPETNGELGVSEIDMPMSSGDIASWALMWLVNFVMVTAFIGLIRARRWALTLGIVAGSLGTITNIVGRALESPSNSEGGFDIGFTVLVWLVPIAFAIYCWWRLNSIRQVGRV